MNLVLFDLDNTLLAGDSDFEWAQFLIRKGVLDREVQEARNVQFYEQYKAGTLDIFEFLDFQLAPLARHPRAQLDAWHREFVHTTIRPMITDKARALVRQHLDDGALVAVVTATNSFVTGPIVLGELGIPHLVATIPAQEGGAFTGKPRGMPAVGRSSVIMVNQRAVAVTRLESPPPLSPARFWLMVLLAIVNAPLAWSMPPPVLAWLWSIRLALMARMPLLKMAPPAAVAVL